MSQINPNKFTSYTLSPLEEKSGYLLQPATILVLRNELSTAAELKISITIDPNNTLPFIQEEAYIRGKMEFIEWLLAMSAQYTKEHFEEASLLSSNEEYQVTSSPSNMFEQ